MGLVIERDGFNSIRDSLQFMGTKYTANNTCVRFAGGQTWDHYAVEGFSAFNVDTDNPLFSSYKLQPSKFLVSQPLSYWYGMYSTTLEMEPSFNSFINF